MKTLSDFSLKGKRVLLRSDLNSEVINGKVIESDRIIESVRTIKELKMRKAKVVIMAHQGKPGKKDFLSLRQHARLLNKYTKIKFVPDVIGDRAKKEIIRLKEGEALLLENVRFEKDEFKPEKKKNNKIIKNLMPFIDIYVNDAFSVCHRNHVSMVLFPKYVESCAGRLLEKEVKALKKVKIKKCLFILGGAKPEDNIKLLKGQRVLACGLFGQLCVISKGKDLGAQNIYLKDELKLIPKLKKKLKNVLMPVDFAVRKNGRRVELRLEEFPSKYEIFDIGKKTQELYVKEIMKAKSIFMKGPAGYYSDKKFSEGTKKILRAIIKSRAFSVLGGGHLNNALKVLRINKRRFGHVSLAGGALIYYIAGEKLPGLTALESS